MTPGPNLTLKPPLTPGAVHEPTALVRDCIVLVAGDNDLYVDSSFIKVFGYDDPSEVSERPFSVLVHPDDRERVEEINGRMERGERAPDHYTFKGLRKNGEAIFVEVSAATLRYNGQTLSVMYLRDITKRTCWEKELRESEKKYRTLFENSMDAIYVSARDGRLVDVNQAFLDLFGYTREEALALNAKEAFEHQDRQRFLEAMRQKNYVKDFALTLKKKDGRLMDCLLTLNSRKDEREKTIGFQGIVRDITAFKKAQEDVRYMAYHDSLTGLPNRMLFSDRLGMGIVNAERNKGRIAVMMLDLDRFKDVNDTFGHDVGDKLLREVAVRLQETVRKGDTVARIGGDEFLLVVPEINSSRDTFVVSEKIMYAFRRAFFVEDRELSVTCSVGIAIYPDHGTNSETLVRRADAAMYEVKRHGRNGYHLDRAGMEEKGDRTRENEAARESPYQG
jgi:diguanylate cyclase (GGDEF)-like protein/PAS domain S-box-containing protein